MEVNITVDENTDKAKKLFSFLKELGLGYTPKKITAKEAALGFGRKATDEELDEYLERCMKGKLTDLDELK
ncbi:MAG: hypothetical protein WCO28_04035 [Bacteroidota bacterium]